MMMMMAQGLVLHRIGSLLVHTWNRTSLFIYIYIYIYVLVSSVVSGAWLEDTVVGCGVWSYFIVFSSGE